MKPDRLTPDEADMTIIFFKALYPAQDSLRAAFAPFAMTDLPPAPEKQESRATIISFV